jgi:hypothetical protein
MPSGSSGGSGTDLYATSTNPVSSAAVTATILDAYNGVIITLTAAGNAQTMASPTITTAGKRFVVINNDTSTHSISVNSIVLAAGDAQIFVWDGTVWIAVEMIYATTTSSGMVTLATEAEVVSGSDPLKVVTPSTLTSKMSSPGAIGNTAPATGSFTTLGASSLANNYLFVDGSRADTYTADGSMLLPFKTVLAALAVVNANVGESFCIKIQPGTYADNLTITGPRYLRIEGSGGVVISGTILINSGVGSYDRIEFVGINGLRAEKGPSLTLSGKITAERTNDSLIYVTFDGCLISGEFEATTSGTWVLQYRNCRVNGAITGTLAVNTQLDNTILIESYGFNEFVGTISGIVSFYNCHDSDFYCAINTTPWYESRFAHCIFASTVSIIPQVGASSAIIYVDGVSYKSIMATTPTTTGASFSHIDGGLLTGAITEILVGGGNGLNPVYTTATGTDAPVRATSPTITTPIISSLPATSTITSLKNEPLNIGIITQGTDDANGVNIILTGEAAGSGGAGNNNGGDIVLVGGVKQGSGTTGNVLLQATGGGFVGIGTSSPSYKTHIADTVTDQADTRMLYIAPSIINTDNNTNASRGISINLGDTRLPVDKLCNSTVTGIANSAFINSASFAGTLTNNYGINVTAGIGGSCAATAAITEVYGVSIGLYNLRAGTTIGTGYALYIESVKTGTITTAYDVYASSATSKNYFAGNVGIGTTAPSSKLCINGGVHVGGTSDAGDDNLLVDGVASATTFDTNVAAAGVTLSGITLSADGTDADININITPKGTGSVVMSKVDINNGTIDSTDITIDASTTLVSSAGTMSIPQKTPVNAVAATGTITVTGLPVAEVDNVYATGTITVNGTPVAEEVFLVDTQTFTFKATRSGVGEVTIDADNTTQASNIAFAINADITTVDATGNAGVVNLVSTELGTTGNDTDLSETATGIAVSGPKLTGGVDAVVGDTLTVGDQLFTFKPSGTSLGDIVVDGNSTAQAANIVTSINRDLATVDATSILGVVYLAAATKGVTGNSLVLSKSCANITITGIGFLTGGIDGTIGLLNEICADTNYIYISTAANTISDSNWEKSKINHYSTITEIDGSTSGILSIPDVAGTIISNVGQGASDVALALPQAAVGYSLIATVGTAQAGNTWKLTAFPGDKIYLDGVAGTDGQSVVVTPVVGDYITLISFKTGASTYDWLAKTGSGTWTAAA